MAYRDRDPQSSLTFSDFDAVPDAIICPSPAAVVTGVGATTITLSVNLAIAVSGCTFFDLTSGITFTGTGSANNNVLNVSSITGISIGDEIGSGFITTANNASVTYPFRLFSSLDVGKGFNLSGGTGNAVLITTIGSVSGGAANLSVAPGITFNGDGQGAFGTDCAAAIQSALNYSGFNQAQVRGAGTTVLNLEPTNFLTGQYLCSTSLTPVENMSIVCDLDCVLVRNFNTVGSNGFLCNPVPTTKVSNWVWEGGVFSMPNNLGITLVFRTFAANTIFMSGPAISNQETASYTDSTASVTFTGNTIIGSPVLFNIVMTSGSFSSIANGDSISGPGLSGGTSVVTPSTDPVLLLKQPPQASGTGVAFTDETANVTFTATAVTGYPYLTNIVMTSGSFSSIAPNDQIEGNGITDGLRGHMISIYGDNIQLNKVTIDTYANGIAYAVNGNNISFEFPWALNPQQQVGVGGIRITGGDRIYVWGGYIECGDAVLQFAPAEPGVGITDSSITNCWFFEVKGVSYGSGLMLAEQVDRNGSHGQQTMQGQIRDCGWIGCTGSGSAGRSAIIANFSSAKPIKGISIIACTIGADADSTLVPQCLLVEGSGNDDSTGTYVEDVTVRDTGIVSPQGHGVVVNQNVSNFRIDGGYVEGSTGGAGFYSIFMKGVINASIKTQITAGSDNGVVVTEDTNSVLCRNVDFTGSIFDGIQNGNYGLQISFADNCGCGQGTRFLPYAGASATGSLTFNANPTTGQTIILNGVTVTFGTDVTIGSNIANTLSNLLTFLDASVNPSITVAGYGESLATALEVTYKTPGTAGNSYTLNGGTAGATPSGSTLTGGLAPATTAQAAFCNSNSNNCYLGDGNDIGAIVNQNNTQSTGNITWSTNPSATQTVIFNGVTITFVSSSPTGNQVLLGATLALTMTALGTFLNASNNASLSVAKYASTATAIDVTYITPDVAGNSYTLGAGTSGGTVSGATLTGGAGASANPNYVAFSGAANKVGKLYGDYSSLVEGQFTNNTGASYNTNVVSTWVLSDKVGNVYPDTNLTICQDDIAITSSHNLVIKTQFAYAGMIVQINRKGSSGGFVRTVLQNDGLTSIATVSDGNFLILQYNITSGLWDNIGSGTCS